jgi:hypothetical protein
MHPSLAFWIWSIAILRAWQLPTPAGNKICAINGERQRPATAAPYGSTPRYGEPDVDWPLPPRILDTLSELHWMERDATLGV